MERRQRDQLACRLLRRQELVRAALEAGRGELLERFGPQLAHGPPRVVQADGVQAGEQLALEQLDRLARRVERAPPRAGGKRGPCAPHGAGRHLHVHPGVLAQRQANRSATALQRRAERSPQA